MLVFDEGLPARRDAQESRVGMVCGTLVAKGHEVLTVRGRRGRPAPGMAIGSAGDVELDLARFEGRAALEGLVVESGAGACIGVGMTAALGLAQVETDLPVWLDLAEELDPTTAARELHLAGDAELGGWHRLVWALDRADLFSVGDQGQAAALRAALGVRGRRTGETSAPVLVVPSFGVSDLPPFLNRWLTTPLRALPCPRVLGRTEIVDHASLGSLRATASSSPSFCDRISRWLRRFRIAARVTGGAIVGGLADALLLLVLGVRAGWLWLASRPRLSGTRARADAGPDSGARAELRAARGRRPRLLIVMPYPIFPPRHGGAVRLWNLIPRLAKEVDVHLLLFDQHGRSEWQVQALGAFCKRVAVHHWQPEVGTRPGSALPKGARLFGNETAAVRVRDLVEAEGIDVVQIEYSELGAFRRSAVGARVVLVMHELAWRSMARRRELGTLGPSEVDSHYGSSLLDQLKMFLFEVGNARRVDEVHLMSEIERERLARYLRDRADRLRVIPNGVEIDAFRGEPDAGCRTGVLLAASFHNAQNVDATAWFLERIWPVVRRSDADAQLTLAGAGLPARFAALDGSDGIRALGEVVDLAPVYRAHRVLVVPLRAGAGTRLKIAEAFAAGTAVVSTRLGAEGLGAEAGRHLLVADDPDRFAGAVVELLHDDAHRIRLATAAREIAERLDWKHAAETHVRSIYRCFAEAESSATTRHEEAAPSLPVSQRPEISILLPIRDGGPLLERVISRIQQQETSHTFEIICIDSGSPADQIDRLRRSGVRILEISVDRFNHGLTRDLGARAATGEVIVFLNQDAMPAEATWLERLVEPLQGIGAPAAAQGEILEFPPSEWSAPGRFFWDSGGPRFYFTSESTSWIKRFGGIGFSTVNAAIRREVWERVPFGWAPILEDKKWQAEVVRRGWRVVEAPDAAVFHSHDYALGSLWRRCAAEGVGWRLLGARYSLRQALVDVIRFAPWGSSGEAWAAPRPAVRRPCSSRCSGRWRSGGGAGLASRAPSEAGRPDGQRSGARCGRSAPGRSIPMGSCRSAPVATRGHRRGPSRH